MVDKNINIKDLESTFDNDKTVTFDPECVRKKSNWSKTSKEYKFDEQEFDEKKLLNDMSSHSPKLESLLNKIEELDKKDRKKHGKVFKHFIFSDLKYSGYGAKMITSALIAKGMHLGYTAESKKTSTKKEKRYKKIEMKTETELLKTKYDNFYLLSSISVYDQNMTVDMKKHVLKTFNQRPDNIHGELARIIVMDSGFKEGIDLFDIKYIHVFEPSVVSADQKQVIGRGTRTCGQKGLEFHPTQGWPLFVYIYDLSIPESIQPGFLGSESAMDLYLKTMNIDVRRYYFNTDLEKTAIYGSVDYELNKNIHSFSIPFANIENKDEEGEISLPEDAEFVYGGTDAFAMRGEMDGGGGEKKKKLRLVDEFGTNANMGFEELRKYVGDNFQEFKWTEVKMENLCQDKKSGGTEIIKYTPTQDFTRHYFTPMNPRKGLLLWHSVGTGKTATAIATATSSFEKQGYTILWVTRTTLKNDIWKNMFEQVCNESLRYQIQNSGLVIPTEQNKRMKLLSKAWRIRPMSYKQFSNLVSKKNDFYKKLVALNGEADPLRKTLLIIDEAHKLYGGGVSSIEQPDMPAFHRALMNSYVVSGEDSAKLLLMTATPISKDPMELIQLINLCKPIDRQLPDNFGDFANMYLNAMGEFTQDGRDKFLDETAGYVSYLNREKDARQFSQPIIEHILTPMVNSKEMQTVAEFDKKIVRDILNSDIPELKRKIEDANNSIDEELKEVDVNTFKYLKNEFCQGKTGADLKTCEKITKQNIKLMVAEAKQNVKDIKAQIKEIRNTVKEKNLLKKEGMEKVKENIEKMDKKYEDYKGSLVYNIKSKCGVKIDNAAADFKTKIKDHPSVRKYDEELENYEKQIKSMHDELKMKITAYKNNIERLKKIIKSKSITDLERSVVKMNLKDAQDDKKSMTRITKKDLKLKEKSVNNLIKQTKKNRTDTVNTLRKTVKKMLSTHKKSERQIKMAEKKLRKTLRKQDEYKEEITNNVVKNIVDNYVPKIHREIDDALGANAAKLAEKQHKADEAQRKRDERATRKTEKEKDKEKKRVEREIKNNKTKKNGGR